MLFISFFGYIYQFILFIIGLFLSITVTLLFTIPFLYAAYYFGKIWYKKVCTFYSEIESLPFGRDTTFDVSLDERIMAEYADSDL
jgi:hypothetical protein